MRKEAKDDKKIRRVQNFIGGMGAMCCYCPLVSLITSRRVVWSRLDAMVDSHHANGETTIKSGEVGPGPDDF